MDCYRPIGPRSILTVSVAEVNYFRFLGRNGAYGDCDSGKIWFQWQSP